MGVLTLNRRRFLHGSLAALGLSALAGCEVLPGRLRPATRMPHLGYLGDVSFGDPNTDAFLTRLRELGYVENQSITIEWRFAEGKVERLPALAAELLALPLDVLVTSGPGSAPAARAVTSTQPIVMCFGGDPIAAGLIKSLAQPGGNVTGVAALTSELTAKRLELFSAALPGVSRVAALWDANASPLVRAQLDGAAQALKLQVQSLDVRGPDDLGPAVQQAAAAKAGALFVTEASLFSEQRRQIVEFAAASRLPASAGGGRNKEFADAGALLTYAASFPSMHRTAADYVDKVLRGARPADLPVVQPTTFDLRINLRTAQTLGLAVPQSVVQQATDVIQ